MEKQVEHDYEKFEADCLKIISAVLSVCEAELAKRNDNDNSKAIPYAALAVQESLLVFLALTNHNNQS